jgi:hypothetical protein
MKRFRKYSFAAAAAAILVAVLTLAAPRAVHALTAALVTVTNTAASPVVSQSVNQLATQNILLIGRANPGTSSSFSRITSDGDDSFAAYVVPSGQSLVITTIDVLPFTTQGIDTFTIFNEPSANPRETLQVAGAGTTQFQFPSGIVFPAGVFIQVKGESPSPDTLLLYMHGYLTSN